MGEAKEKNGLTIKKLSDLKTNYGINEKVIECLKEKHRIQGAGAEFLTELQKEVFSNPFFWDDSKNLLIWLRLLRPIFAEKKWIYQEPREEKRFI